MFTLTELLDPRPSPLWTLVRQVGVEDIVTLLDGAEQSVRWSNPLEPSRERPALPPPGERAWELPALRDLQQRYADHGLRVAGIEDTPPLDDARLGGPRRDEQIEWFCDQLRAMRELGIPVLCWNWAAVHSWSRTRSDVPLRGGALATGYEHAVTEAREPLLEPGSVTDEDLWRNLEYFLKAVVPVAEETGVRLAVHPDDPPVTALRGVPRILRSPDALQRAIELVPSEANGVTLCQGTLGPVTDDMPATIRRFGERIHFVHFRDVAGTAEDFHETFHDDGPTDMLACLEAYRDAGFAGPLRPDHVPTLAGEDNAKPGYATLGRLHAIGYIAGLREAVWRNG